jgi:hypothetical protein
MNVSDGLVRCNRDRSAPLVEEIAQQKLHLKARYEMKQIPGEASFN